MPSASLTALVVAIGSWGLARADCIVVSDWTSGPQCVTGNGGDVTSDIVSALATCMINNPPGNVTISGNGAVPDFGSGLKINWYQDNFELYMINTQEDDVCVDTANVATIVIRNFQDGCQNTNWSTGGEWDVKLGVAQCDAVYGCTDAVYAPTDCSS
ncbi:uncharacterized protein N7477_000979 [Penicillium maclennaniae]|uniref:uncharacterized protein n=1 Tax=Penicillium maclennaniae TaxID=1343394 RepID=UPI00253F89B7|nr:uncharacterized protein N7477_000979 [Penicillium maclennaniae]KAJ5684634.1 hypothetical protein N7477_000979 [Penicillium maclennaniae]